MIKILPWTFAVLSFLWVGSQGEAWQVPLPSKSEPPSEEAELYGVLLIDKTLMEGPGRLNPVRTQFHGSDLDQVYADVINPEYPFGRDEPAHFIDGLSVTVVGVPRPARVKRIDSK